VRAIQALARAGLPAISEAHDGRVRIVGIAGSLRRSSFNGSLLDAAAAYSGDDAEIIVASIAEIPLYNFDVEKEGIPPSVTALKDLIATSDGLLLATPEYNNSMPGVLKNAIDWLTRPPDDIPKVFYGRPVALMGASIGEHGTLLSQTAWLAVLRTLRVKPWFGPRLLVTNAEEVFDQYGGITSERVRRRLERFVRGFVEFVREEKTKAKDE
jgi:chromate reductase, NAD(P)H dehydrogenase (quinone)